MTKHLLNNGYAQIKTCDAEMRKVELASREPFGTRLVGPSFPATWSSLALILTSF